MMELDTLLRSNFSEEARISLRNITIREFITKNSKPSSEHCYSEVEVYDFDFIANRFVDSKHISRIKSADVLFINGLDLTIIELKQHNNSGRKTLDERIEEYFKDGNSNSDNNICANCGHQIAKCTECNRPVKCGNCLRLIEDNYNDGNIPRKIMDTIITLISICNDKKKFDIIEKLLVAADCKIIPILLFDMSSADYIKYSKSERHTKSKRTIHKDKLIRKKGGFSSLMIKNRRENEDNEVEEDGVIVFNCSALDRYITNKQKTQL